MRRSGFGTLGAGVVVLLAAAACSDGSGSPSPLEGTATEPTSSTASAAPEDPTLAGIPAEARTSDGGGGPRLAAYWAEWNSCAPDNRAAEAAASGGREAGFVLVDDLIADPGIQIGEYRLGTCQKALDVLERAPRGAGKVANLAAELLTAELNLSAGAESCPAAEEIVVGAYLALSAVGFDGDGATLTDAPADVVESVPRLVELLASYNRGELCL